MSVPELRSEILGLCDILQAVLAFNYSYPPESRKILEAIRRDVPTAPARWLREQRDRLREEVKTQVRRFGLRENPRKFAQTFKSRSPSELGIPMLPKFVIDRMFTNYTDKRWLDWPSEPTHLFVYLDFTGRSHRPMSFDWKLAEASLYEDMCIAYNLALDSSKLGSVTTVPVPEAKIREFCTRGAVLCAFYFVEAYLNGVAFDFYMRGGQALSDRDMEALLEWDEKAGREKWLNFKDKLYKYPKIILGVQHPPLTENNSAEVKLLLSRAKDVRDSIVHQSPKADLSTGFLGSKVANFMHLRLADATEIVDAAISFVTRLNTLLGAHGIKLDWLTARDSSGRFPERTFL